MTPIHRPNSNRENWTARELIQWTAQTFEEKATLACSFGPEDMVLIDLWSRIAPPVRLFFLDTGRLHTETYRLVERTQRKYEIQLDVQHPEPSALRRMIRERGVDLFYSSLENRQLCCQIRKVQPLERALEGKKAWLTGLRRDQSLARGEVLKVDRDSAGRFKISPLADWTEKQIWSYIRRHQVPYNSLHDQGFQSIGCAPCTRAIRAGEESRAGRWWWEQSSKECGLHSPRS